MFGCLVYLYSHFFLGLVTLPVTRYHKQLVGTSVVVVEEDVLAGELGQGRS
jgi:hypothetical protein